jgi:hypothetical protein
LLAAHRALGDVTLERGIVEHKTRFDDIPGGVRNHDLLVLARARSGPIVVGIEAKADETFDHDLTRFVATAKRRSPRTRAPERLDRLTRAFFASTVDEDPTLAALRYQLLSSLAGTLAEAFRRRATAAVLVVHEFVTPSTATTKREQNAKDLGDFLARFGPLERSMRDDGWLVGPFAVPGNEHLPPDVPAFVGKLVTRRG